MPRNIKPFGDMPLEWEPDPEYVELKAPFEKYDRALILKHIEDTTEIGAKVVSDWLDTKIAPTNALFRRKILNCLQDLRPENLPPLAQGQTAPVEAGRMPVEPKPELVPKPPAPKPNTGEQEFKRKSKEERIAENERKLQAIIDELNKKKDN